MFSIAKTVCAVLALTSIVLGKITIQTTSLKGNATNTVIWSSDNLDSDPTLFTLELANPVFRNNFAVLANIGTAQNSVSFVLPDVLPGPDYSIQFVNPGNVSDIFAETAPFTIGENDVGTSAADPASTTITTAVTTGGSTILTTITPSVAKTSSNAVTLTSPVLSLSSPTATTTPSSFSMPSVSTTAAPAASSAAPNGAGIVHVPVGLLVLGIAAGMI